MKAIVPSGKTSQQYLAGLINNARKRNELTEQEQRMLAYYLKMIAAEDVEDNSDDRVRDFVINLIEKNKLLEEELIIIEK